MTDTWLHLLDARLRALLPLATALLAVLVDVLPLFHVGPASVTPLATLCVAFFWSLYRPDLFGAGAAFATGLAHDALAGLPLGLSSLVLLLVRHVVVLQQRFFVARSFPVIWCCFVLLALAALALRWALSLPVVGAPVRGAADGLRAAPDTGAVSRGHPASGAGAQRDPEDGRCIVRWSGCAASRAARCCSAPASSPCSACWRAGSTIFRWSRPTSTRCSPTRTASTTACCRRRAAWCSTATACRSPATGRPIASW